MKPFIAVLKKEFRAYTFSLLAYVFVAVFLVASSLVYFNDLFLVGQTSMRSFFTFLPWFLAFFVPTLSMRLWSEELKQGTYEVLTTLPVSRLSLVISKFLAPFLFLVVVFLFSLPIPIMIAGIGELDWGPVIASYFGALLLGASYLAMGQWISLLFKNQIIALIITVLAAMVFLLIGLPFFVNGEGVVPEVLYYISTPSHFDTIAKGVIDIRDVAYFISIVIVFKLFTIITLKRKLYE